MGVSGNDPGLLNQPAALQHPQPQPHHHSLHFEQSEQQQPVMDELLDHMLSMPSWSEMGGIGRIPWDYNAGGATSMQVDSMGTAQKLFTMSLMPPGLLGGALGSQGLAGPAGDREEANASARVGDSAHNPTVDALLVARLHQQRSAMQQNPATPGDLRAESCGGEGGSQDVGRPRNMVEGAAIGSSLQLSASLTRSQSVGSSGSEESGGPKGNGHTVVQPRQGFGGQEGGMKPHAGIGGGVRPRVRARRGQATDPHSIAERLRRERIAERLKALQELVPNSNKTDKASMLDEIIEYLKFLQIQVKVLSMSRLGGAGAASSLVTDLASEGQNNYAGATISRSAGAAGPVQDGLALTERQVARLMEDDMGSAMQYLQSKGLCLMPISLATAISTTNNSGSPGGPQSAASGAGDRQWSSAAGITELTSNGPANDNLLGAGRSTKDIWEAKKTDSAAMGASEGENSDDSRSE